MCGAAVEREAGLHRACMETAAVASGAGSKTYHIGFEVSKNLTAFLGFPWIIVRVGIHSSDELG